MSENNDNGVTLSLLAAGGMSTYDRKRKADRQPRDASGRWVGAGANVRWRSNGQDWAGTVEKMIDGKAIVKVRHSDGSESTTTLLPSTLKVMASKARLSSVNRKYFDENALTSDYIKQHQRNIEKAAEKGGARIERPDGYSVDIVKKKKKKDDEEDNPLLYQLYAPNGSSRGIYSTPGAIDNAIGADTPAPAPAPAPISASGSIDIEEDSPKAYNLPKEMIENISFGVQALSHIMSDEDIAFFSRLANGEPMSIDEVEALNSFATIVRYLPSLYGGDEGLVWLNKITSKPVVNKTHDFDSGQYEYFVSINDDNVDLLAVDYDEDKVLSWTGRDFGMDHGSIEKFDAESIQPLDNYSAKVVADQLTDCFTNGTPTVFNVSDLFPYERNMFDLAMSELSTNYLDSITELTYNHAERSVDAQYQTRGEGGKFAGNGQVAVSKKSNGKYFAIVDSVDPTAVLDIVVVASGATGPEVFRRSHGSWHSDPQMHEQLTGPTPPNVVFLDSEEQIKDVLSQVDAYDFGEETTSEVSSDTEFALKVMIQNFDPLTASSEDLYNLIVKAKKFNRMDLIPEDLRAYKSTIASDGLYGEYGEVITASASTLGNTPLERLENYWISGEGSDKIDWKSSDSIEYATKVFTKYLGEKRAFAFATLLNSKANV